MEEDTAKIWDTIGTVFIQGPSILLLVWRSIMFNGSFLRVCRILRFMKKLDFPFLSLGGPRHGAQPHPSVLTFPYLHAQNPVPPPTLCPTELRHATFERCRGHAALLHLAPPQPLQEVRRSSVKHAKPSSPALCLCVTRIVLSPQTPVRADLGQFIATGVPPVRLTSCAPS